MKKYIAIETISIGYILLLLVLLAWGNIPILGVALALILECPVAGFYLHVMRHQLESAEANDRWHDIPSWSRNLIDLFREGFFANLILVAYYALMAVVFAIPFLPIKLGAYFVAKAFGWIAISDLACVFLSLPLSILPLLWVHYLLCPLALARFAHTGRFTDAFDIKLLSKLAWTKCRFAWQAALLFLIFNLINIAVTMGAPNLIVLVTEPSIEFTSLVIVYKRMAKSYKTSMDYLVDVPPMAITRKWLEKLEDSEPDSYGKDPGDPEEDAEA